MRQLRDPMPDPKMKTVNLPGEIEDVIILTVKLRSGGFESQIEIPVYSTRDEIDKFVMAWLGLMDAGIKIGQRRKEEKK